jgi:hypothetical protein
MGGLAVKNITITLVNRTRATLVNGVIAATLYGSDNGSTWVSIGSISGRDGATSAYSSNHTCTNYNDTYTYFRITPSNWARKGLGTDQYCGIGELYIYGKTAQ